MGRGRPARSWAVAAAVTMIGCVEVSIVECPDGTVCGGTAICAPSGGCAEASLIAACAGRAELDACVGPGIEFGICVGGVCEAGGCGNGLVEPIETCDDGNRDDGDGCRHDCSSDETCGNGQVDVVMGEECDDRNDDDLEDGCRSTCKIIRCGDGVVDETRGEVCDDGAANSNAADASCRLSCQRPRCGDGIVDPARQEICDDGNLIPGDGCRPDCKSIEQCGDGTLDLMLGELCDDDNARGGDGCSAGCRPEPLSWRAVVADPPSARSGHGAVFDAARGRMVVFGGKDGLGQRRADTFEYGAGGWRVVTPAQAPSARDRHAMAYDAARGRTILFGGHDGTRNLGDTWAYDGVAWREVTPSVSPAPRRQTTMAYDAARDRVVLFGGADDATTMADTWEYDGQAWIEVSPSTSPPARYEPPAMAFDARRGVTVLFGGRTTGGTQLADTWEYDGTTWTQATPTVSPSPRWGHAMVFDAGREEIVVVDREVWAYDGNSWGERSPVGPLPPGRVVHTAVYDTVRSRLVMFGGEDGPARNDTWELVPPPGADLNPWTWDQPGAPAVPAARTQAAAVYDAARARVVLVGGQGDPEFTNDTWLFDGGQWTRLPNAGSMALSTHGIAYDAARRRVIVFGGNLSGGGVSGFTFALSGTAWQDVTPAAPSDSPPARRSVAMAYDAARDRVVLFGGADLSMTYADTWEYDGAVWSQVPTATVPPRRTGHALAYDAARGRTILFGGESGTPFANTTWSYDGTDWTALPIAPEDSPPNRVWFGLAYDPLRQTVVLFGGDLSGGALDEIWELDGEAWTRRVPSTGPAVARFGQVMTFDPSLRRFVVFGGQEPVTYALSAATFTLGYDELAAGEACSSTIDYDQDAVVGCDDDDCWAVCTPACAPDAPVASCPATAPACGDLVCDPTEDCRSCPADCVVGAACPILCGDFICDVGQETDCPGDCPSS